MTLDTEHKFDLALQLENRQICYDLAVQHDEEEKWLQLSTLAGKQGDMKLVEECYLHARAFHSLLLLASASSNRELMSTIADQSTNNKQFNIAFVSNFVLGRLDRCLDILIEQQRIPEAAFFARTYLPSQMNRVVELWKEKLKQMNMQRALASPMEYENLFPNLLEMCKTEEFLKEEQLTRQSARNYPNIPKHRIPIVEMTEAETQGHFSSLLSFKMFPMKIERTSATAVRDNHSSSNH